MIIIPLIIFIFFIAVFLFWKFIFFFRDPSRIIPAGNNIISPADGTVVYVRKVKQGIVPISVKKKKEIHLSEISKIGVLSEDYYIIGIFMHPTSVHVNRAPIEGVVKKIVYTKARNLPMTLMWWRVLFGMKPYELYSPHIFTNERNTILIHGLLPVFIIQIADIYVNKIQCWIKEGQKILKGEKLGRIIMGSQVDLVFPYRNEIKILVRDGQKVKAGETIIAEFTS